MAYRVGRWYLMMIGGSVRCIGSLNSDTIVAGVRIAMSRIDSGR